MRIIQAEYNDLKEILTLQRLAYQSEAKRWNDPLIQPLTQSLEELEREYQAGTILKAMNETNQILGSVRGFGDDSTFYIGKLMVHPDHRGQGIGSQLVREIEAACPYPRYELFTSIRSLDNIRLYKKLGYTPFQEKEAFPGIRMVYLEKIK